MKDQYTEHLKKFSLFKREAKPGEVGLFPVDEKTRERFAKLEKDKMYASGRSEF